MKKYIFLISIGGVAFSGYMSGVKLFSKSCAFGESCPYFLGYPACYFGFLMFLAIFIFASLSLFNKIKNNIASKLIIFISFIGILFSGYFTATELPVLFERGFSVYFFGLPTCALGLIFYFLVFILSLKKNSGNYK